MTTLPGLIVGAGPTGMLLAIWLRKLSPSTALRIIDKSSGPCQNSRAIIVQARTMEFYRQIGIIDDILKAGHILRTVQMHNHGHTAGELALGEIGQQFSKYGFLLSLPQDRHEQVLLRHLDRLGVAVEWNTKLEELSDDGEVCTATITTGIVRARYVAGCDGLSSTVRKQAGIDMQGDSRGVRFFVADVDLPGNAMDMSSLRICLGSNQFALCLPLDDDGRTRVLGQVPDELVDDGVFADIQQQVEQTVKAKFKDIHWSSIYRVTHQVAKQFSKGRIFILGDAAHVHSPVGGQGMNTGLGDATNLAWKLHGVLNNTLSPDILSTYEAERRPFAKTLVETIDRAFTVVIKRGISGIFIRSVMLAGIVPIFWRTSIFPKVFFTRASQIGITYANGPLGGTGSGLKAGDRLPWLLTSNIDNYEPLRSCSWQIHMYTTDGQAGISETISEGLKTYRFYGLDIKPSGLLSGCRYLIRPDGYVAVVAKDGTRSIQDFLRKWKIKLIEESPSAQLS